MANINENYLNLQGSYLFANIAKKVNEYQAAHPDADIIRLGYIAACSCNYRCHE